MLAGISCTKCGTQLLNESFNKGKLVPCPRCAAPVQVEAFPALFRPVEAGAAGERIVMEGEAACFYHPQKKAVVPCESCGRFLCALCDVELNGRHLCPACLEAGKKKRTIGSLEDTRMLYNRQALVLSLLPLLITGPVAVYCALRYWKAPSSLVIPMPWAMPVALCFGILQTLLLVWAIVGAFAT